METRATITPNPDSGRIEVAIQCLIHVDLTDFRRLGDPDLEEAGGDTVAAHMLNMLRDMRTRSNSQVKSKARLQDFIIITIQVG